MNKEHSTKKVLKTVILCHECKKIFTDIQALAIHQAEQHPQASASSPAASKKRTVTVLRNQVTGLQPKSAPKADVALEARGSAKESGSSTTPQSNSRSDSQSDPEPQSNSEQPESDTNAPSVGSGSGQASDAPADEVSRSAMDVEGGSSQLLDDQMGGDESKLSEVQPDVIDKSSANKSLSPAKPVDTETQASKVLRGQTTAKLGNMSADQRTGGLETKTGPLPTTSRLAFAPTKPRVSTVSAASPSVTTASSSKAATLGPLFACRSCDFKSMDKDLMIQHIADKHGPQLPTVVSNKSASSLTKKPVREVTLYACGLCDAKFPSVEVVKAHINAKHQTPRDVTTQNADVRRDTLWSTHECVQCASLFQPSVRLRDIYMNLSEWMNHFYQSHGATEKVTPRKQLELRPCHRCGLVFFSKATRLHHNVISHDGKDPEIEMQRKQREEERELVKLTSAEITPKSLPAKARSRVIVDSLMKASLVSRTTPAVVMDKAAARRAQIKVFAARSGAPNRVTNVVFKCSKCGGMFPDDPSFERHAREVHSNESGRDERPDPPPATVQSDPPMSTEVTKPNLLEQRECSDCSKLMESCPRSNGLFVRRDVWERHVNEVHVHLTRCVGVRIVMHPCPHCPRLFLNPHTLEAHKTKLHDTMLGPVDQADVDACTPTKTLECSRCSQLVQNADGLRFLDGNVWNTHFETDHKELLLCDGKAGEWELFSCSKCPRLFFNERDLPVHEARQAFMHMTMPINAKVVTQKGGPRVVQDTEILYQCANDPCSFTCKEHAKMVEHFQQCRVLPLVKVGETLLFKTVMVRKLKRPRHSKPYNRSATRRLENVMKKLAPDGGANGDTASVTPNAEGKDSEAATAVTHILAESERITSKTPAVLELDPVTCQPRLAHSLEDSEDVPEAAAEDVPEAAAEEETVAAEEALQEHPDTGSQPTRMDFACSVCQMRGSSRNSIAAHIRRDHKRSDGTYGPDENVDKRQEQVKKYKHAYLCAECKEMAKPCQRTRDLFFEKAAWLNHLATTHNPLSFSELDRLDLHECEECERLFLSYASLKRHSRAFHEPGAENYQPPRTAADRRKKHKFSCFEEGCTFTYHRVPRLRSHLIAEHNFDLAVREVVFNNEHDFQEWKKTLELSTNAYFMQRSNVKSKRKSGTFEVRYFGCSRVMANLPTYKENGKKRSLPWQVDLLKDDMVWRCPAFLKAEVASSSASVRVSFCPNHYGHEMDPSFGRLSDADEAEIGGMLRAGLSIQDVLKRMREEGRLQGTPSRKQRVTEFEINRIFEKYMGMKPPKAKRYDPLVGKAVSRSLGKVTESSNLAWNAELISSYDDGAMTAEDTAGDELPLDNSDEAIDESAGSRDVWQRVCGEDGCRFTTTSVGFLRSHLRQRHGFAMHIDTAGFTSMKDFTRWKRSLEKRTCAKYLCYKTVASSDPSDPVVTQYFTCHRSGLNSLKRAPGDAPLPRRLVLCTGYMKVRMDNITGEVACEYCASHYGHDARLAERRASRHRSTDMIPIDFETVEETVSASPTGAGHFMSPMATRYSFVHDDAAVSDQEVEQPRQKRPRGRPPKKRTAVPRRSRGGKRRRWEEFEEEEEEEEQQQEDSSDSD
ncbi:uncharacterized protein LOC122394310 [Amphibalanus amphitrite]|uniref:uncharacterized protein LOC122394310 n=1 Tax=Amphibalanus amphitrite TaxID=1232801 RepID=UPI001C90A4F5|nr:uncharacterized protein LOC122394310 [Amphibalanus amphitrite]